jgi:hypothetical protein
MYLININTQKTMDHFPSPAHFSVAFFQSIVNAIALSITPTIYRGELLLFFRLFAEQPVSPKGD